MTEAFSTQSNTKMTLAYLLISGLSAIASVVAGIDDNPPGALLALIAAIAFILAFSHPWRTPRKFIFLLLASVVGFVFFLILSITSDSIIQNPASSVTLRNLIESPVNEAVTIIFIMVCSAAFIVGVIGSVVMFIRRPRRRA